MIVNDGMDWEDPIDVNWIVTTSFILPSSKDIWLIDGIPSNMMDFAWGNEFGPNNNEVSDVKSNGNKDDIEILIWIITYKL